MKPIHDNTVDLFYVADRLVNILDADDKDLRKEVNTGANGTQDYVVKKGVNKDTIATTRQ